MFILEYKQRDPDNPELYAWRPYLVCEQREALDIIQRNKQHPENYRVTERSF